MNKINPEHVGKLVALAFQFVVLAGRAIKYSSMDLDTTTEQLEAFTVNTIQDIEEDSDED